MLNPKKLVVKFQVLPNMPKIADFVERELRAAGVEGVTREPYDLVVPIDKGASMEILDGDAPRSVPLLSLWPNLVRTNTTGPEGISGNLFYGGKLRDETVALKIPKREVTSDGDTGCDGALSLPRRVDSIKEGRYKQVFLDEIKCVS